jgi:6-phosphogluconolactonase/glucosamine-6-phosphate isomerase/deaminase
MKTNISSNPTKEAREYISQVLREHSESPVLFFISGGSALRVLECIEPDALKQSQTIMMMDERFTKDQNGNNFSLLTQTTFFKNAQGSGVEFISTLPKEDERHEQFSERIDAQVETYLQAHSDAYVLGLFGIGEDGHTASIFPATEQDFIEAYTSEHTFVPITRPQEQYPFRISITPAFIEEKISEAVLYAVGSKKCDNILSYMHTKNFGAHEIPALIPARHPESTLFTDCVALL